MSINKFNYVLFDIDGVLATATNSADEILRENNLTLSDFFENWSNSDTVASFEAGKIDALEFAKKRQQELALPIEPEVIINILTARKSVLFDGAEALLTGLASRNINMACLSNTNILHWNSIIGKEVFHRFFCKEYLSYELGLTKPSPDIYHYVLNDLQCEANKLLYFDDSKKNIDAAIKIGISAVLVKDFNDLAEKLKNIIG